MGDIAAVLIPPQERRFREITGVGDAALTAVFTGWNKHVLVADDRVFLFPRHQVNVEWLERELAVYSALDHPCVARLLERWDDEAVSPYPFAAVTRLYGDPLTDLTPPLARQLGELVAEWHAVEPPAELAGARPPRHHQQPHLAWLRRALDPATTSAAAADAATELGFPVEPITNLLGRAAAHERVLVHGDVHEDQLLITDGRITGVLDWETARVDHPFWDFDFGEWATRLWRTQRAEFNDLWREMWQAYAGVRRANPDPRPLIAAFRVCVLLARPDDDEHRAALAEVL